jgi:hypothetical protein
VLPQKGDPVPDAKVVLLDGPAKDPENLITNFTDDRGEFSFRGVPFGRYQLWAWKVDQGALYLGPESLAKEESHGTSVSVRNEAPVSAEVELLEPEKQNR